MLTATPQELAKQMQVDTPTIIRYAQSLGIRTHYYSLTDEVRIIKVFKNEREIEDEVSQKPTIEKFEIYESKMNKKGFL